MAPTTQSITLEETCLDDYVSKPIETQEADTRIRILKAKVNEIDEFLEENSKNIKSFERAVLRNVKQNRVDYLGEIVQTEIHKNYSELDLSFLSMHHKIKKFKVPRFAIYKYEGDNKFGIEYSENNPVKSLTKFPETIEKNLFKTTKKLKRSKLVETLPFIVGLSSGTLCLSDIVSYMTKTGDSLGPSIIVGTILGTGFGGILGLITYAGVKIKSSSNNTKFSTEFNGLIPVKTKVKAEKAKKDFGEELYLITETKPKDWKQKKIVSDPLLIGVLNDKSYLIDHFDCTSMENYIRKEFTS